MDIPKNFKPVQDLERYTEKLLEPGKKLETLLKEGSLDLRLDELLEKKGYQKQDMNLTLKYWSKTGHYKEGKVFVRSPRTSKRPNFAFAKVENDKVEQFCERYDAIAEEDALMNPHPITGRHPYRSIGIYTGLIAGFMAGLFQGFIPITDPKPSYVLLGTAIGTAAGFLIGELVGKHVRKKNEQKLERLCKTPILYDKEAISEALK